MNIKKWLLLPWYVLSIGGQAKSFKENPVIGSRLLNRLGLHVLRYCLAHALTQLRWWQLRHFVDKPQRLQFQQQGFLLLENFLSPQQYQDILAETQLASQQIRQCVQGNTLTQRLLLDDEALQLRPALMQLVQNKQFNRLQKYAAASRKKPLFYIQMIKNGFINKQKTDPQKNLHSDTFHPCMKAWLFLEDVRTEDGPFTYVPGSQRFSMARLKWEYQKSCQVRDKPDGYSEKGSLRISAAELTALNLPQAKAFTVKANTLVIANTHGFHARGPAVNGASRLEIWSYSRSNPFNPFAGLDVPWMPWLTHKVLNHWWTLQDSRAQKRGSRASWHRISADEFIQR